MSYFGVLATHRNCTLKKLIEKISSPLVQQKTL